MSPSPYKRIKSSWKLVVLCLIISIVVSSVQTPKSQAASVRLNKKTASVLVEKSIRLSVSGTKKSIKWYSSNPEVATVSSGKVTGKQPGKTVITAKVAGKTLKCTVTVKYNANEAEKKIKMIKQELNRGLLLKYTNKNSYSVSIVTTVKYRDAANTSLSETEDHNFCLEPGRSTWMYFPKPVGESSNYIAYKDYKIIMKSSASKYKGYAQDITQWCKPDKITANVTAYNYSGKNLTAAKVSVLFYNMKGQVTGYMAYYPACLQKGTHTEEVLNYPTYLSNPAKVETFVDYAY